MAGLQDFPEQNLMKLARVANFAEQNLFVTRIIFTDNLQVC